MLVSVADYIPNGLDDSRSKSSISQMWPYRNMSWVHGVFTLITTASSPHRVYSAIPPAAISRKLGGTLSSVWLTGAVLSLTTCGAASKMWKEVVVPQGATRLEERGQLQREMKIMKSLRREIEDCPAEVKRMVSRTPSAYRALTHNPGYQTSLLYTCKTRIQRYEYTTARIIE